VAHIVSEKKEKAALALLIDDSASMRIEDQGESRVSRLINILQSQEIKILQDRYDVRPYSFSNDLKHMSQLIPDSLSFKGTATDIASAMRVVIQKKNEIPFSSIVLLSDGRWNSGEDPVRISQTISLPVYAMVLGEDRQQKDLMITRIQTNEVAYANDQIPIEISVRGPGFGGLQTTLTLQKKDSIYHKQQIQIPREGLERTVRFFYTPKEKGLHHLTAILLEAGGEVTHANNVRDITLKVLQSKWKVLLLAHGPSPDLAFVKRLLEKDDHVQLTVRTEKRGGGFYEGKFLSPQVLDSLDLLLLLDYPSSGTPLHIFENISKLILNGKPIFMIAGKHLDVNRFSSIQPVLPFLPVSPRNDALMVPRLTQTGETHTMTQIRDNSDSNREAWNRLPPIFYPYHSIRPKPESQILVEAVPELSIAASQSKKYPLFLVRHVGQEKSAALLGSGFYRWDLLMWGVGEDHEILKGLLSRTIRWLVARDEIDRFFLKADKRTYRSGEQAMITLQVYDEMFQPINNADVEISISHENQDISIPLNLKDEGLYTGSFRVSEKGIYRLNARILHQGQEIGRAESAFSVITFNPEFLETRANPQLMKNIARFTGGKFGTPDSLSSWVEKMDFPTRQVVETRKIRLYNTLWLLVATFLLLSAEWFIRKRKGML